MKARPASRPTSPGASPGRPAWVWRRPGPAAPNLASGVGCAYLDRSPLIAITCNLNTDQLGRRIQMWIDHHALFGPITKATLRLPPGRIAETVAQAIRLAMSEPRGPVHLDLPEDVAVAPARECVPKLAAPIPLAGPPAGGLAEAGRAPRARDPAPRPAAPVRLAAPPAEALAKAGDLIARAARPIAVIGA